MNNVKSASIASPVLMKFLYDSNVTLGKFFFNTFSEWLCSVWSHYPTENFAIFVPTCHVLLHAH